MRKIRKIATLFFLVFILQILSSCQVVNTPAAISTNYTLSSEEYFINLFLAYCETCEQTKDVASSPFLTNINGESATVYIYNKAIDRAKLQLATFENCDDCGITLNESELKLAKEIGDGLYSEYNDFLSQNEVERTTFDKVCGETAVRKQKLLVDKGINLYDNQDQVLVVPVADTSEDRKYSNEEITNYFLNNYYYVAYIVKSFTNNNIGNSYKELFNDYANRVNKKEASLEEIEHEYKIKEGKVSDVLYNLCFDKNSSETFDKSLKNAVENIEIGQANYIKKSEYACFVYKKDIETQLYMLESESLRSKIEKSIKDDENTVKNKVIQEQKKNVDTQKTDDMITEQTEKYNIEINQDVTNSYNVEMFKNL